MMVWSAKPKGNSSTGNMMKCVVVPTAGFRQEVINQEESYIILLVNALHMHFCSSVWQFPLYFMADSNRNCPCAVGFGLKNSKPLAFSAITLAKASVSHPGKCILASISPECLMRSWQIRQRLCLALWEMAQHIIRWQCIMQGKLDFSYSFFPFMCDCISD